MKKIYQYLIVLGFWFQPLLLLFIRLYWGYAFHVAGCNKFSTIEKVTSFFSGIGIPWPEFNAYLVATVECVGGTCLILGLASRLVAVPLAVTMFVALIMAHEVTLKLFLFDQDKFLQQSPVTYLMAALVVFAFGAGALSLDALLSRFFSKKSA